MKRQKNNKLFQIVLFIVLSNFATISAANFDVGIGTLLMDVNDARNNGMGNNCTAIADDISALSINPAGLASIGRELSTSYMLNALDINLLTIQFGYPIESEKGDYGTIGIGFNLFFVPEFSQVDALGNTLDNKIKANDFNIIIGYGINPFKLLNIRQNLNLGFTAKYINSAISDLRRSTFAFSFGALYKIDMIGFTGDKNKDGLGFGFLADNIGMSITFASEKTKLPWDIKVGVAYTGLDLKLHKLIFSADLDIANDSRIDIGIGMEYVFLKLLYIRAGVSILGKEAKIGSFGVGGFFNTEKMDIRADYSIIPMGDMGFIHNFSIHLMFRGPVYKNSKLILSIPYFYNVSKKDELAKFQTSFPQTIHSKLMDTGKYKFIDRVKLAKVLSKMNYKIEDLADEKIAIKVAKRLGADLLITGEFNSEKDYIDVNANIINPRTGNKIAVSDQENSPEQEDYIILDKISEDIKNKIEYFGNKIPSISERIDYLKNYNHNRENYPSKGRKFNISYQEKPEQDTNPVQKPTINNKYKLIFIPTFQNKNKDNSLDTLELDIVSSLNTYISKSSNLEIIKESVWAKQLKENGFSEEDIYKIDIVKKLANDNNSDIIITGDFEKLGDKNIGINATIIDAKTGKTYKEIFIHGDVINDPSILKKLSAQVAGFINKKFQ